MNTVEEVRQYVAGLCLTYDEKQLFRHLLTSCEWSDGQFSFATNEEETVVRDAIVISENKAASRIFAKVPLFRRLWKKLCPFQDNQFGEYVSHATNWCGDTNAMFVRLDVFPLFDEWALNECPCSPTEKLVSYEVAKLLKQIGFCWECDYVWYEKLPAANTSVKELIGKTRTGKFYYTEKIDIPFAFANDDHIPSYIKGEVYAAPTLQMAQDYLRGELGYHITVTPYMDNGEGKVKYAFDVYQLGNKEMNWIRCQDNYTTPDDAATDAVYVLLENYIEENGL